jgi:hypothetical protein
MYNELKKKNKRTDNMYNELKKKNKRTDNMLRVVCLFVLFL